MRVRTLTYDPAKHDRRSIRLPGYDYSEAGAYFVTVCTHNRGFLFGEMADEDMRLNNIGRIVAECWRQIPMHGDDIQLDEWVVMPNHIHGIIIVGARHAVPLPGRLAGPV